MAKAMLVLFGKYNSISLAYEDLLIVYEDFCELVKNGIDENEAQSIISALSSAKNIPIDFANRVTDELFDEIRRWLDSKYDILSDRTNRQLPDNIEYGEHISIVGVNCRLFTLSIGKLLGRLEAGSEEQIDVSLISGKETVARGCVKITVGYLNFDEDGGAADGIDDSIVYEVDDVLYALQKLISELNEELVYEQKLANSLEECMKRIKSTRPE